MGRDSNQPGAGSTPAAPTEEPAVTTGLGAKVKDAFKRATTAEQIQVPPDEDEEGQKAKPVGFPSRELRRAFIALGTWAMGLSTITKVFVALGMGSAIAVPVVVPILSHTPEVRTYYLNRTEPLQPVPHPTAFEPLTELEINTEVEILKSEEGYALVRTASARVGYVTKSSVDKDRLELQPEDRFTNCNVRWNEKSASLCHVRANTQQEACSAICARDGSQNECTTACATNLALCMESCAGVRREEPEPTPAPAVAATEPGADPEETAAVEASAPSERPEGVVQFIKTKADEDKKKAAKKRRKKKRRRRAPESETVRPEIE